MCSSYMELPFLGFRIEKFTVNMSSSIKQTAEWQLLPGTGWFFVTADLYNTSSNYHNWIMPLVHYKEFGISF